MEDIAKLQYAEGMCTHPSGTVYIALNRPEGDIAQGDFASKTQGAIPVPSTWVARMQVAEDDTRFQFPVQLVHQGPVGMALDSLLVTLHKDVGEVWTIEKWSAGPETWAAVPKPLWGNLEYPYGLARMDSNTPQLFGNPGDLLFAEDRNGLPGRLKKKEEGAWLFNAYQNETEALQRTLGLALGDFNGSGVYGYGAYAAESDSNKIIRFNATGPDVGQYTRHEFAGGIGQFPSVPRNVVFDPYSPYLFVSESDVVPQALGKIWRVNSAGNASVFATQLVTPRGIAFLKTGVMVVVEKGANRLTVLDGWRYRFNRGDANADAQINITDPIVILNWLFSGGPEPPCLDAADADDNSFITMEDAVYLLDHLSQGGPPPPPPYYASPGGNGQCGFDGTADLLGCLYYPGANCTAP
jgi:hypothetical protein